MKTLNVSQEMQHRNLFVFDIETVTDLVAARNLLSIDGDDEKIEQAIRQYHLDITDGKNDFLRQPFHRVITISFVEAEIVRDFNGNEFYRLIDVRSAGSPDFTKSEIEEKLIKGFFAHLGKNPPRLISFNGRNFDLPVLKYAAMKHQIPASWFYKNGDKWNNYNQRYSLDWHCDLAEAFSDFGASARVKMNELCAAFNLPGKIGIDGSKVSEFYRQNRIQEIRNYCETDVLNTYLLYLVYQHHTGTMTGESFLRCQNELREFLQKKSQEKPHFAEFLKVWQN